VEDDRTGDMINAEFGIRNAEFPPHPNPPPRGGRDREGVNEGTGNVINAEWGLKKKNSGVRIQKSGEEFFILTPGS